MREHPDVAVACGCGWPCGAAEENEDCAEYRKAYAEEHFADFLAFAQAGQPDILADFIEHYRWKYKDWLN